MGRVARREDGRLCWAAAAPRVRKRPAEPTRSRGPIGRILGRELRRIEMLAVLGSATAIRIRGDAYVCDASGDGREAVYVNNLRLESPAAAAVLNLPR